MPRRSSGSKQAQTDVAVESGEAAQSTDEATDTREFELVHHLVEGVTLREAARRANVPHTTAVRLSRTDAFQELYRDALRQEFIRVCQRAATQAGPVLDTLIRIAKRGGSSAQLGAASRLIELMQLGLRLEEQERQLTEIEKAVGGYKR